MKDENIINLEYEMISNLKVIKAYNYEEHNLIKFKEINDELAVCSFKATFFSSLTNPCTRFVNSIVYALVALIGALFVINPFISGLVLSVGELTCYLSYANQYTKPFNEISSVITERKRPSGLYFFLAFVRAAMMPSFPYS